MVGIAEEVKMTKRRKQEARPIWRYEKVGIGNI